MKYQLIDFGLALSKGDSDVEWKNQICGTFSFMPVNVHHGQPSDFVGDIESLLYSLIYLANGNLEWSGIRFTDPLAETRVLLLKQNVLQIHQTLFRELCGYRVDLNLIGALY